jgi:hypothetical protein
MFTFRTSTGQKSQRKQKKRKLTGLKMAEQPAEERQLPATGFSNLPEQSAEDRPLCGFSSWVQQSAKERQPPVSEFSSLAKQPGEERLLPVCSLPNLTEQPAEERQLPVSEFSSLAEQPAEERQLHVCSLHNWTEQPAEERQLPVSEFSSLAKQPGEEWKKLPVCGIFSMTGAVYCSIEGCTKTCTKGSLLAKHITNDHELEEYFGPPGEAEENDDSERRKAEAEVSDIEGGNMQRRRGGNMQSERTETKAEGGKGSSEKVKMIDEAKADREEEQLSEEEALSEDEETNEEEDDEDDEKEKDVYGEWFKKKPLYVILELTQEGQSQNIQFFTAGDRNWEGAAFLCPMCQQRYAGADTLAKHLSKKHYHPNASMMVLTSIIRKAGEPTEHVVDSATNE